ncbi:hypothetical protein N0V88_006198 [Collariella sp. IMI 366227]|nr:hypothetical protein N0V88_006198 [Collariella sp. IMI 366227]
MTLDRLQPTLKEWAVAVSDLSSGERDVRGYLNYAAATQRAAYNQFMGLVAQKCFDYPGSEHLEICRLINYTACLGEALWITTEGLFYAFVGPDTIPPNLKWANAPILHDDSLFNTVVADGWCPSTINYLISSANLATLRLALLQGALYEEQHPECTGEKCALVNVDTDHYFTQHTSEGCGCSFLGPDVSRIAELLRQEKIPVIRPGAREDSSKTVSISVLDGSCTEYVAFSHVWADGLGSTSEVGLPACQLRRLAGMASELVESGAFWIDGLCVPGHADLRKLAIRTMADTYRKAKAVLVLDNGIMAASSTTNRTDILLRAFVSRWMRRLWTFQEAVLAKDIYIKVSDTALPLMRLVPEFKEQLVDPVLTGLGLAFASLVSRGRARIFNITDVARELRWRDTSKTADETLAIASLLNMGTYRCNAILLLQALSPGDNAQAVAVLFDRDAGTSRETPFIPYLYQRRVLIGRIHSPQGAAMDLRGVTVRTHGELQVRIS